MRDPVAGCLIQIARAAALLLLLCAGHVSAVERVVLAIGDVGGEGWQAQGAQLQIELARDSGLLQIARLTLPSPIGELRAVKIECPRLNWTNAVVDCPRAQFQVTSQKLDAPRFAGGFRYETNTRRLQFHADDLPIGGSRMRLVARFENPDWHLDLQAPQLTYGSADGALAMDKLAVKLEVRARPRDTDWAFDLKLMLPAGQAYYEPVFADFGEAPLKAQLSGHWRSAQRLLVLDAFTLDQSQTLQARGALALDFSASKRLQSLQLQIDQAVLPGTYTRYLQPFLIGTVLDSLETQGQITGSIGYDNGAARQIKLKLSDVHLDDKKRRFALYGASGEVNWQADPVARTTTRLRWEGGSAYRVDLGAAELQLRTAGRDVQLVEPVQLPVLDGRLDIRRFELAQAGSPNMHIAFDGTLSPVGMEGLCRALGWPIFGGSLSGTIPTLEYRDGNLSVGGTLAANVFDGRVEVDKLQLEQPFGVLPKLSANMKLRRIDLESATRAFSFGRIEGRLDGDVKDLRLLKWRPVAFDGRLYTTPNDDTRHRISQRAIENISDLGGGGAAGALSRGFLRFFDDFAYDRIALGCRLQDGVCSMTGLEPHRGGGYYIVKGSLVPRIDVIGFATRVSWDGFVRQLKAATESEGPVIKK